jgi:hypothetical protein
VRLRTVAEAHILYFAGMNPELLAMRRDLAVHWFGATDGQRLDLALEFLMLGYALGRRTPPDFVDGADPDDEVSD